MTTEQICTSLIGAMEDLLEAACQTNVADDDPSRALIVRAGRLQDDPTTNYVHVLIHPNDPDDRETWHHEIIRENLTAMQNPWGGADFRLPQGMYEIGGGEMWWRRFTIQLTMFWIGKNLTRTQARDYSFLVLGRAEEAIKEGGSTFGELQDSWEESVWGWFVRRSWIAERGGPDVDWIWDAKIWVEFGTQKP